MDVDGSIGRVVLLSGPAGTALGHALTTEHEEVMSLLIGYTCRADRSPWVSSGIVDDDTNNNINNNHEHQHFGDDGDAAFGVPLCAVVVSVVITPRMDRRSDRVEISAEQLTEAALEAERLSDAMQPPGAAAQGNGDRQQRLRVIGWMHSHPHITAEPSHVDLRTQGECQLMDRGFFGLIVSCFGAEGEAGTIRFKAFQSRRGASGWEKVDVPLEVAGRSPPSPLTGPTSTPWPSLAALQAVLLDEERSSYYGTKPAVSAAASAAPLVSPTRNMSDSLIVHNTVSIARSHSNRSRTSNSSSGSSSSNSNSNSKRTNSNGSSGMASRIKSKGSTGSTGRGRYNVDQATAGGGLPKGECWKGRSPMAALREDARYAGSMGALAELALHPLAAVVAARLRDARRRKKRLQEERDALLAEARDSVPS